MLKLRTEEEIIASWKGDIDKPVVSICCLTYNHEKYIEEAIRGFLIQETDFPFEIIIHDDASTDRTQEIIREYCDAYPRLFKPILQEVNQYSQGINPGFEFLLPAVVGEYVAFCEGDDYWIQKDKISSQVQSLGLTNDVDLCFHRSAQITGAGKKLWDIADNLSPRITTNEIIKGGGGYIPTASIMIKANVINSIPDWVAKTKVSDYWIQCYAGLRGGAIYSKAAMSVYRRGTTSSVLKRMDTPEKRIQYLNEMFGGIRAFNLETSGIYKAAFLKRAALITWEAVKKGVRFRSIGLVVYAIRMFMINIYSLNK